MKMIFIFAEEPIMSVSQG